MIKSLVIALLGSSLVSASSLLCQDSSVCNKGSKRCKVPSGEQWCCKDKAIICNENSQCSFLVPYLPFIQLRPGTTEYESSPIFEDNKIFYSKSSGQKIKSTPNYLLRYHCEPIDSQKAVKVLKLVKSKLDTQNWQTNVTDINCPGRKQRCPPENTCCLIKGEKYGCCRYTEATCCPDLIHCCPPDTVCNTETMECTAKHMSRKMELLQ